MMNKISWILLLAGQILANQSWAQSKSKEDIGMISLTGSVLPYYDQFESYTEVFIAPRASINLHKYFHIGINPMVFMYFDKPQNNLITFLPGAYMGWHTQIDFKNARTLKLIFNVGLNRGKNYCDIFNPNEIRPLTYLQTGPEVQYKLGKHLYAVAGMSFMAVLSPSECRDGAFNFSLNHPQIGLAFY